jgi:hypothetical protein
MENLNKKLDTLEFRINRQINNKLCRPLYKHLFKEFVPISIDIFSLQMEINLTDEIKKIKQHGRSQ